jgi:hypothetical protein
MTPPPVRVVSDTPTGWWDTYYAAVAWVGIAFVLVSIVSVAVWWFDRRDDRRLARACEAERRRVVRETAWQRVREIEGTGEVW